MKDTEPISALIELSIQKARQITKQIITKRNMINGMALTRLLNLDFGKRRN